MGLTLAIDPGPTTCGAVLYDPEERHHRGAWKAIAVSTLIERLAAPAHDVWGQVGLVLIERVQSYGISGKHLLETSESVGRLWQAAEENNNLVRLIPRRFVCQSLDVTGSRKGAKVRQACMAILGPPGRKAEPGPTYGVTSHAWQALGLALAYHEAPPSLRARIDEECVP